jgi:beta-lactam-binding protein with PASTA domain
VDISFVPVQSGQDVIVASYVGLEYREAQDLAVQGGLKLSFVEPHQPQEGRWIVVAQNPVFGTEVTRTSEVRVWVQDHPDDSVVGPSNQGRGDDGGPSGGVREPRRPLPGQDDDAMAIAEGTASPD